MLFEMERHAVKAEILEFTMCIIEDCSARVLIDAAGLHADETVLAEVNDTDTVTCADFVELGEELDRAELLAVDANRFALFKVNGHIFRFVRSILRSLGNQEHAVFRFIGRVFKVSTFMGQMPNVSVHGIGLVIRSNGDIMLLGIFDFGRTGIEVPFTPRSNQRDVRSQSLNGQLETNLVIALAGSAVSNSIRAFLLSDFHQLLGNNRTGKGRTEQVLVFVNSTGFERRPYIFLEEFFLEVSDIYLGCTGFQRLVMNGIQFIALTYISAAGDNFAAVIIFLQPGNDNGGIKTAGISENYFVYFLV